VRASAGRVTTTLQPTPLKGRADTTRQPVVIFISASKSKNPGGEDPPGFLFLVRICYRLAQAVRSVYSAFAASGAQELAAATAS
jgi:hypothetical protein